jgi:hypothetical protein
MEIKDVIEEKEKAERVILEILNNFESKTECSVYSLDLFTNRTFPGKTEIVAVTLTVKL